MPLGGLIMDRVDYHIFLGTSCGINAAVIATYAFFSTNYNNLMLLSILLGVSDGFIACGRYLGHVGLQGVGIGPGGGGGKTVIVTYAFFSTNYNRLMAPVHIARGVGRVHCLRYVWVPDTLQGVGGEIAKGVGGGRGVTHIFLD